MKGNRIKVLLIVCAILLALMSCTVKEDKVINDNRENNSIKVALKSISQEEYDNWVVPSYEGNYGPDGKPYPLPEIADFDYPYVEGVENKEMENKINQTIKNAIFNDEFFSLPMAAVSVATTPWSEFEFPGIIMHNDILSIPITLYWSREKSNYKSMSITIDMKTGERLFLEDIIELNEEFAYKLIYEEDFFINIDVGGIEMTEYLYSYYDEDEDPPNEASKSLLETLRKYESEDEKPEVELFYLTKDGIVLTHFANDGVPQEINTPLENLQDYLKIESWK